MKKNLANKNEILFNSFSNTSKTSLFFVICEISFQILDLIIAKIYTC